MSNSADESSLPSNDTNLQDLAADWGSEFSQDLDWSSNSSYVNVVEEALGEFSDQWGFTSYPSTPVTLIDIPEVQRVAASFTYNFYTKSERTEGSGTFAVVDINNMTPDEMAIASSDTYPRFNKIHISPARFDVESQRLASLAESLGPDLISSNLDILQTEDTVASSYFSSAFIKDDLIDEEFYESLKASISFFGLSEEQSGNTDADTLSEEIDTVSVFSPDGLQIKDALSNIQSQGVAYAPTDTRSEITNSAFQSVNDVDFALNINNKFVRNIIEFSLEDKSNIYENELRSLMDQAELVQSAAISYYIPGVISSDEFNITVGGTIDEVVVASSNPVLLNQLNEHSCPVGYIIEKYELAQTGEDTFKKITHKPLIVENYGLMNVLDLNVRYGGTYIYNVRTVALTQFEAFRVDTVDDVEDQVVVATILVASSGLPVKVDCTENIPPNPPQNLKFHWDYQERNLVLLWEEELNDQRDVVRYQIFRRKSVNVPFTLLREIDFDESTSRVIPLEVAPEDLITKTSGSKKLFYDRSFTKESVFIYCLAGVDARGFSSNYSSQFMVSFDMTKNKIKVQVVSQSGAPKPYPNIYLNQDLFVDSMKDSGHTRMRVFFDPEYFDVFKTNYTSVYNPTLGEPEIIKDTEFLDLLSDTYKLQVINVDNQMSDVLEFKINDEHGPPMEVPVNQTTLNTFGFGNLGS